MKYIPLDKVNVSETRLNSIAPSIELDSRDYPHISYLNQKLERNTMNYTYWDGLKWSYNNIPEIYVSEEEIVSSPNSLILDSNEDPYIAFSRKGGDTGAGSTLSLASYSNEWNLNELNVDYDCSWIGLKRYDRGIDFSSSSSTSSSTSSSSSDQYSSSSSSSSSRFESVFCMTGSDWSDGEYISNGNYYSGKKVYYNYALGQYLIYHTTIGSFWGIGVSLSEIIPDIRAYGGTFLVDNPVDAAPWFSNPSNLPCTLYEGPCVRSTSSSSTSSTSSTSTSSSESIGNVSTSSSTSSSESIGNFSSSSSSSSSSSLGIDVFCMTENNQGANGEYVYNGNYYNGRKVFYNAEADKYLYYYTLWGGHWVCADYVGAPEDWVRAIAACLVENPADCSWVSYDDPNSTGPCFLSEGECSSSSSSFSSSSSSSSSYCCIYPICSNLTSYNTCSHFDFWTFDGMQESNSTDCSLYADFVYLAGASTQYVSIYNSNLVSKTLVAYGSKNSAGTITLVEQNGSGLSGSVVWDGTIINYPEEVILTCEFPPNSTSSSSTSSSSSSSSIDSSSSSSDGEESSSSSSFDDATMFVTAYDSTNSMFKIYAVSDVWRLIGQKSVVIDSDIDSIKIDTCGKKLCIGFVNNSSSIKVNYFDIDALSWSDNTFRTISSSQNYGSIIDMDFKGYSIEDEGLISLAWISNDDQKNYICSVIVSDNGTEQSSDGIKNSLFAPIIDNKVVSDLDYVVNGYRKIGVALKSDNLPIILTTGAASQSYTLNALGAGYTWDFNITSMSGARGNIVPLYLGMIIDSNDLSSIVVGADSGDIYYFTSSSDDPFDVSNPDFVVLTNADTFHTTYEDGLLSGTYITGSGNNRMGDVLTDSEMPILITPNSET